MNIDDLRILTILVCILGAFVIAFAIYKLYKLYKSVKEREAAEIEEIKEKVNRQMLFDEKVKEYCKKIGFSEDVVYKFENSLDSLKIKFYIDRTKKEVLIVYKNSFEKEIAFDDIIGFEVFINKIKAGGVGRAIAGGILAGDTGALIGVATTGTVINSYKIVIYLNDIVRPKLEIDLIKYRDPVVYNVIGQDKEMVKSANDFANNINASIKAIIFQREVQNKTEAKQTVYDEPETSIKEKLLQLNELHDMKLISDEEYEQKRAALLQQI